MCGRRPLWAAEDACEDGRRARGVTGGGHWTTHALRGRAPGVLGGHGRRGPGRAGPGQRTGALRPCHPRARDGNPTGEARGRAARRHALTGPSRGALLPLLPSPGARRSGSSVMRPPRRPDRQMDGRARTSARVRAWTRADGIGAEAARRAGSLRPCVICAVPCLFFFVPAEGETETDIFPQYTSSRARFRPGTSVQAWGMDEGRKGLGFRGRSFAVPVTRERLLAPAPFFCGHGRRTVGRSKWVAYFSFWPARLLTPRPAGRCRERKKGRRQVTLPQQRATHMEWDGRPGMAGLSCA